MSVPGSPRLPWADVPADVRRRVDELLGSPVVAVSPRTGGFSPGPAVVVTCASGRRAFVKAVGTPLNPDTPDLLRAEARVAAALPHHLPVPRFLGAVDDGECVALVLEEVEGACPALPWTPQAAAPVLAAVARFAALATPCPVPGLRPIAEVVADELSRWPLVLTDPPADLDPWELAHRDRLLGVPDRLTARGGLLGDTLVHLDLRADNLLLTPSGDVVLLDWPWACTGPAWVDTVLLAVDMAANGGLDPVALVAGSDVVQAADPADLTDFLAGMAGMWAVSMRRPAPPGLPTIRAFQRRFHDTTLAWVQTRARLGLW